MQFIKFTVENYKCFRDRQTFYFGKPIEEKIGSGITYIVGSNNSGKTTLIESLSIRKLKNINTSEKISSGDPEFILYDNSGIVRKCALIRTESSTIKEDPALANENNFEIISSRRHWGSNAGSIFDRVGDNFHTVIEFNQRQNALDVASQLRTIESNDDDYRNFILLIKRVIPDFSKFAVAYEENHYIEYITEDGLRHKSDLLGDGVITAIRILVQLFANKNNALIIDEPELSLHPSAQRNLLKVLGDYSKRRQIIISTHSPYMMDWSYFRNGAVINRIAKEEGISSKIYTVNDPSKYASLLNGANWQMPFIMDEVAKEIFFMSDGILFLEGQEDVGLLRKESSLSTVNIFGYGVRGATNFKFAFTLAKDLGFKKVACIIDGGENETSIKNDLEDNFPDYEVVQWNKNDIRDKEPLMSVEKEGYYTSSGVKKEAEELEDYNEKLSTLTTYLAS